MAKEGESTFQRFFPSLSLLLFASDNGFPLPLTSLNAARAYRSRVRQPSFTGFDDGAGDAWSDGDDDLLDAAAITKGTITPPPSATFAPSSTSADANDSAPLPPQQQHDLGEAFAGTKAELRFLVSQCSLEPQFSAPRHALSSECLRVYCAVAQVASYV